MPQDIHNRFSVTNVSIATELLVGIEVILAGIFIFRSITLLFFRLRRGRIARMMQKLYLLQVLRFLNLVFLMYLSLTFESQVCFCFYRKWFYDHCYYFNGNQYSCFHSRDTQENWVDKAIEWHKFYFKDEQFVIMQRSF